MSEEVEQEVEAGGMIFVVLFVMSLSISLKIALFLTDTHE